jgi:transposase
LEGRAAGWCGLTQGHWTRVICGLPRKHTVQETLRRDPHSGHVFAFRGRRGDLIKILWADDQGMCLFSKRLERGRFIWPTPADGVVTISPAQLGYLLEGIDWRMPLRTWRPAMAG